MKKYLSLAVAAAALVLPVAAGAAYFAAEDNITVREPVADDVYTAGQAVRVEGDVAEDAWTAGQSVEITGQVGGDAVGMGNTVTISGAVGDDVGAAGSTVRIASPRLDDLFAAGASVLVDKATTVQGDAFLAGESVDISGTINGNVRAAAARITVRSGAVINGSLTTYGNQEAQVTVEDGATVRGERKHVQTGGPAGRQEQRRGANVLGWVMSVLTGFVLALVLYYGAPRLTAAVQQTSSEHPWRGAGIALLWLFLIIPVGILLLTTVIGIPMALLAGVLTVAFIILAIGYAGIIAGQWLAKRVLKRAEPFNWQHILLGVAALAAIKLVPVIGWVVGLVVFLVSLGAVITAVGRLVRGSEQPTA